MPTFCEQAMLPRMPHKRLILALRLTRFHVGIAFSELLENFCRTLSPPEEDTCTLFIRRWGWWILILVSGLVSTHPNHLEPTITITATRSKAIDNPKHIIPAVRSAALDLTILSFPAMEFDISCRLRYLVSRSDRLT